MEPLVLVPWDEKVQDPGTRVVVISPISEVAEKKDGLCHNMAHLVGRSSCMW